MRLLNAKTFAFEEFFDSQVPKYAILSHTWRTGEITYKDMVGDHAEARKKAGWSKIENTSKTARSEGLEWVWIDTCSIDKSSSAELSEAINSMFRWYKNATICYAFLDDVSVGSEIDSENSEFATCRWFKRGWTLQELIAPVEVNFYVTASPASEWHHIGTRTDLKDVISAITRIPSWYLLKSQHSGVLTASVAQRMSWASRRETTREEDVAYCLLGLFDVNMPLLYGEGDKAFQRLQEEIMRNSTDQSLLAWGLHPLGTGQNVPLQPGEKFLYRDPLNYGNAFAMSPCWFENSGSIRPLQFPCEGECELISIGVRMEVLVIDIHVLGFPCHFIAIECYDDVEYDKIALPVMLDPEGRYIRIMPYSIFPVNLSHLTQQVACYLPFSESFYRRRKEKIVLVHFRGQGGMTARSTALCHGISVGHETRVVLRRNDLELSEIYPKVDWIDKDYGASKIPRDLFESHLPNRSFKLDIAKPFTMAFKCCSSRKLLLVSLEYSWSALLLGHMKCWMDISYQVNPSPDLGATHKSLRSKSQVNPDHRDSDSADFSFKVDGELTATLAVYREHSLIPIEGYFFSMEICAGFNFR